MYATQSRDHHERQVRPPLASRTLPVPPLPQPAPQPPYPSHIDPPLTALPSRICVLCSSETCCRQRDISSQETFVETPSPTPETLNHKPKP